MIDDTNYPILIKHRGTGDFFTDTSQFESSFEIIQYPQNTYINVSFEGNNTIMKDFFNGKKWGLSGKIESGKTISIADLHLLKNNDSNLIFTPFKEVVFGDKKSDEYLCAEFPLIGLYENRLNINIDNWDISINGDTKFAITQKSKSYLWNIPLEGLILSLKYNGATIEKFLSKANDICLLLSLALGNDIIFNRQFYNEDNSKVEIWRRKVEGNSKPDSCVIQLNLFLQNSLPIFEKWGKEKKDIFFVVLNYINSSGNGFLEHRLLGLCTAWETFATNWAKEDNEKDEYLNRLKKCLKKTIDDFDNSEVHDKDLIKDRISSSLDWNRLTKKLSNLLDKYSLDVDKLGLEFGLLVKVRNEVAHNGKFQKNYTKETLVNLVSKNKLALQVLLLKELNYDKSIFCEKDGWSTAIDIKEFNKQIK